MSEARFGPIGMDDLSKVLFARAILREIKG